ncbi:3-isopropylmalate dehydratase small subunit [Maricaulis sp.]|uniref:3-isopropylmalate dehydratase small subunit n=1 Tax=Maricaulis sp. TaxID=1486257 RepID=UPI00261ECBCB|nr:3-isopropylmalate dehydratase small subunit [Maricaulis sp.]
MSEFENFQSRAFVLPQEDIDTDQIIPARFLTTTSRAGLGAFAFHDWRFDRQGQPTAHPLVSLDTSSFQILVGGRNFGCGSSREHAPWALLDFGFKAVISSEIADIFRSNAARNGLLPIVAPAEAHAWLLHNPGAAVTIDLAGQSVQVEGGPSFSFDIEPFARHCLLEGTDPLGFLLARRAAIQAHEARMT